MIASDSVGIQSAWSVQASGGQDKCQLSDSELVEADSGSAGHYFRSGKHMTNGLAGDSIFVGQRQLGIGNGTLQDIVARGILTIEFHQ